jgi:hypothetical protein
LKTFCQGKIAKFKIPKYFRFTSDFPMTASGKIQKFKLREMHENELGVIAAAAVALDDERWAKLTHAYGSAMDIPPLLRKLAAFPPYESYEAEPYFSLWSALCHQGDVYSASYAAVPHIVQMMKSSPDRANWPALDLVTRIEIARSRGNGPEIEKDLAQSYHAALSQLPEVVAAMAVQEWDETFVRVAAAALTAAKGRPELAEAIQELEPDRLPAFMDWVFEQ